MNGKTSGLTRSGEPARERTLGLAIAFCRRECHLSQAELAGRVGLGERTLRTLEAGEREPSTVELARFSAALDCEPTQLRELAGLLVAIGRQSPGVSLVPAEESLAFWSSYSTGLLADALEEARTDRPFTWETLEAERRLASEDWNRVAPLESEALKGHVPSDQRFWRWSFVERLCLASLGATAHEPDRARDLAEIAVEIAAQVGGELAGRRRLQSYAWAFFSNALRVSGDLAAAEGALAKSRSFRELSSSTNPALLGEERFLEIEASLRRAQRRFPEALICMRRALAEAEVGARQELLLNLGNLLIEMSQHEEALSPLEEAIRLVDPQREPRLAWAARFNLLVCLCALDRAAEGETWLPELREIASALGNGLDQVRLRWLESQVHAALGRTLEAIETLEEARDAFALRGMQYDVALAGLELCVLLLQEGRVGEVKEQAPGLAVTFQELGIERERLATLTLFCAAAQVEQATVDQARAALAIFRQVESYGTSSGR